MAEYFTNVYTNPDYRPEDMVICHVDEFLKLLYVLTGDIKYENMTKALTEQERGGLTMCRVLDYHEELGEARGLRKGEERLSKLIQSLLADKLYDIIALVTSDKMARETYYKKYSI